jgi:prepilin-type N-terminal cleavage/methylation domain-containing protein
MKTRNPHAGTAGFSLVEVLTSVAILSIIVIVLLGVFYQTQRAFRSGVTQVDIFEGARSMMQLVSRELQELTPSGPANIDFLALESSVMTQDLPGNEERTNVLEEVTFVTRFNDDWTVTTYHVFDDQLGAGALFRRTWKGDLSMLSNNFYQATLWQPNPPADARLVEGVVHFRFQAFDTNGVLIPQMDKTLNNTRLRGYCLPANSTNLPAYLELELGLIDDKTYANFRSQTNRWMATPPSARASAKAFFQSRSKQVHLFRQRIPLRTLPALAFEAPRS